MPVKVKLSVGDVFGFHASVNGQGCGQILHSKIIQYIVVFEPVFANTDQIEDIVESTPLLSGWTSDARFYSGDWTIIGHAAPLRAVTYPHYKVGIRGETWVTDFEGKPLRLASADEEKRLTFHTSFSPMTFEKAFRAHHGDLPWEERFEQLLVKRNRESSE